MLSLVFFVGLGKVHLFDWDEINFAESAREMITSGNYLRVQINYLPFWEKPPLFFWLQMMSMQLLGISEFAARFPNALFGFIYLVTFYLIGKKHNDGTFGLIWALVFFASVLPHVYFKSGIIDPVFNYFIFLSIYFMTRVFDKAENRIAYFGILSGVFSGMSVLTKGPVGFLLLALTFSAYVTFRRFNVFPKFKAFVFFLIGFSVVISCWMAMELSQNGWRVLEQFIAYQAELFSSPVAGHEQPFYYHFVVVLIGCFPMSILALPQFIQGEQTPVDLRIWMLSLFWVVMILFSLSTTKIIHYSSMTYAPLSFLAALALDTYRKEVRVPRVWKITYPLFGLLFGLLLTLLPLVIYNKELIYPYINDPFAVASLKYAVRWSGFEFLIGVFFVSMVIFAFIAMRRKQFMRFLLISAANTSITLLLVLFFILPKIEQFTQGPMITFCEQKASEDCYMESYGFKSYVQYYYGAVKADKNPLAKEMNWLLVGPVDKPVYLISKITNEELDTHPNFKRIGTRGGFNFYRREISNYSE